MLSNALVIETERALPAPLEVMLPFPPMVETESRVSLAAAPLVLLMDEDTVIAPVPVAFVPPPLTVFTVTLVPAFKAVLIVAALT